MKQNQLTDGLTLIDLLIVIAVLFLLAALLTPKIGARTTRSPPRIGDNNLKQVGLAFRIWVGDGDAYPQAVSVTNRGATEAVFGGNIASVFQVMSCQLYSPKIQFCPTDKRRIQATTFDPSDLSTGKPDGTLFGGNANLLVSLFWMPGILRRTCFFRRRNFFDCGRVSKVKLVDRPSCRGFCC